MLEIINSSLGTDYEYDDLKGGKTSVSECMLDTEEVFLIDKNAAICLNANVNINEFKYVVQESLTNTLGSQYPFIRRNGNTKYRQFTITGTICGQGDTEGLLLSRDNAWGIIANSFYADYALKHHIAPWNNYLFEKVYRDTAIAFLMNGKPKIFKSLTEGNMIV